MSGSVEPGGSAVRPRTIAQALEQYGRVRLARCAGERAVGIESMLEIVACFCDEVAPAFLDPMARRRLVRRGGLEPDAQARYLVEPDALLRLLVPCARLFPYQIVAGAGVLASFREEIPRLARWLLGRGIARAIDEPAFRNGWEVALRDIDAQVALQVAIERAISALTRARATETVVGRFRVEEVTPEGLHVRADGIPRGPVRVPPEALPVFAAGHEASLAFQRSAVGWTMLAATLPCRAGALEEMMEGILS